MKIERLSPIFIVNAIEPCLEFWTQLGFEKMVEVPEEDRLGFIILQKDGVEKFTKHLTQRRRGHVTELIQHFWPRRFLNGLIAVVWANHQNFVGMQLNGWRHRCVLSQTTIYVIV